MDINVFGIETNDLYKMIYDNKYKNSFFFYCDVEEYCYSCDDENGYNKIRRFNNYWLRQCIGIPVCSRQHGCYKGINTYTRQLIDNSFKIAISSIQKHGFDKVFYQVSEQTDCLNMDLRIYEEHPFVDCSVSKYIMEKMRSLSKNNIQLMIKRSRANTI
jgi:hypothetical protein